MTTETDRSAPARLSRFRVGERIERFIYGTIVVMSVIVAEAKVYPDDAGGLAVLVVITTVAFWLPHVYARSLASSVAANRHISLPTLWEITRQEGAIVEAGAPPIVPLLLAAVGLISEQTAVWLAVGVGMVVLAIEGILFARAGRLGLLGTAVVVLANLALGLLLVGLKVAVTH